MGERTLLQEICDDLFGPARVQLRKARKTIADHIELRAVIRDEKALSRLHARGYLDNQTTAQVVRAMLRRIQKGDHHG